MSAPAPAGLLRTLLVLGRVSNVPTVWSNCLAGWLLGGGGDPNLLTLLCLGATLVYVGGMFLNDAFDAEFDRQHRAERPIPSGAITEAEVWRWGLGLLGGGTLVLIFFGTITGVLAVLLLVAVLVYDALHKHVSFSPVLMAACRFLLYLVAASTGSAGVTGLAVWGAFALAAYIIGLSYIARRESTAGVIRFWPALFLASPIALALLVNAGPHQQSAGLVSLILGLWMLRSLRWTFWSAERQVGRTVSGLLAGIVFVDLLAVATVPPGTGVVFLILFGGALIFQRIVPAT